MMLIDNLDPALQHKIAIAEKKLEFQDIENIWYYYLTLESDMIETSQYIEPNGQENTYSFAFYKIILLSCCEIESVFKIICELLEGTTGGSIKEYKQVILKHMPKICEAFVIVPRWKARIIEPFAGWEAGKLSWWNVYSQIKHTRAWRFENATYNNAVYALSALYLLIQYLYQLHGFECKADDSKYFDSDYYHRPIYGKDYKPLPCR